jgi:hypothetical protein
MAVVRELVTLLTYKVDETGIQKYAAKALSGLKKFSNKDILLVLGIAFSIEKDI